jgi:hypothetical protein
VRALSERQAGACENAKTTRCRCRCGGEFHGATRCEVTTLPEGDPHYPALAVLRLLVRGVQLRFEAVLQ